jgi:hypothetical protein
MGQQFRQLHPALAVLRELKRRWQYAAHLIGELYLAHDVAAGWCAGVLQERGLGIEQVYLTRSTVHEEVNDGLRFRSKMRRSNLKVVHAWTAAGSRGRQ